jgi:hypothetical protein
MAHRRQDRRYHLRLAHDPAWTSRVGSAASSSARPAADRPARAGSGYTAGMLPLFERLKIVPQIGTVDWIVSGMTD